MPRLAIISDIHGNLPALEAVLADIQDQGIQEIFHLGDLVGYNPFPNETVARIAAAKISGITGNYDQAVLALIPDPIGALLNTKITPMGKEIYAWTVQAVTPATREFLLAQPRERSLQVGKWRLRLTHGSPRHIRDYVRPSWPDEMVADLLAEIPEDVLLVGHTHIPLIRQVNGSSIPAASASPKTATHWPPTYSWRWRRPSNQSSAGWPMISNGPLPPFRPPACPPKPGKTCG